MDPLSITASIVSVIQLATTLMSYINSVKQATEEQKKVAIETSNLLSLLTSLRYQVEKAESERSNKDWLNQVKLLGTENGPLDQFRYILEELGAQVSTTRKRDHIPSSLKWKFTKSDVDSALQRMERLKSLIQCALTEDVLAISQAIHNEVVEVSTLTRSIHGDVGKLVEQTTRLRVHVNQELHARLARWLSIPDPSTNYQAALKKRHPGTGRWLLEAELFNSWQSAESSLMWLHGNAGCGKTVLSAAALESILQQHESRSDTTVSYFYFDFNDSEKQTSQKALRSLLFQFAEQIPAAIQSLEQMYRDCRDGQQQPTDDAVQSLLQDILSLQPHKYIVLDALDECYDCDGLLTVIQDLMNSNLNGLRILVTSRRERDIEEKLKPVTNYNIDIQAARVDKDIQVYLMYRLATDPKLKKWPEPVQAEITTVMMDKAHGMFRWVECQLESIRQCVKLRQLRLTLQRLPKTLDETYERILQRLESTGQLQDAIKALQWLCYSNRPLRLSEMVEVLAIENGDNGGFFPEDRLPEPMDIMVVCSSLISCNTLGNSPQDEYESLIGRINPGKHGSDDEDGDGDDCGRKINARHGNRETSGSQNISRIQIQLAHFSVKEYLLSDRCAFRSAFTPQTSHLQIAKGCLLYLLYLGEQVPRSTELLAKHPLVWYSVAFWWKHIMESEASNGPPVVDLAIKLLTTTNGPWMSFWQQPDNSGYAKRVNILYHSRPLGPPYSATKVHASGLVEIPPWSVVNAGKCKREAEQIATASTEHTECLKLLPQAGADANAQTIHFGTALEVAELDRQAEVARPELKSSAYIEHQYSRRTLPSKRIGNLAILRLGSGVSHKSMCVSHSLYDGILVEVWETMVVH